MSGPRGTVTCRDHVEPCHKLYNYSLGKLSKERNGASVFTYTVHESVCVCVSPQVHNDPRSSQLVVSLGQVLPVIGRLAAHKHVPVGQNLLLGDSLVLRRPPGGYWVMIDRKRRARESRTDNLVNN